MPRRIACKGNPSLQVRRDRYLPFAAVPPGPYVIVRLLPPVRGEPHYCVKSTVDKHGRALLEGQIWLISREPENKEPASARSLTALRRNIDSQSLRHTKERVVPRERGWSVNRGNV